VLIRTNEEGKAPLVRLFRNEGLLSEVLAQVEPTFLESPTPRDLLWVKLAL
jgi:hypothetical protein